MTLMCCADYRLVQSKIQLINFTQKICKEMGFIQKISMAILFNTCLRFFERSQNISTLEFLQKFQLKNSEDIQFHFVGNAAG